MRKRLLTAALCLTVLICLFPTPAKADMGPKPSVQVQFEGISEPSYYVTLLSRTKSTGPYSYSTDPIDPNHWLLEEDPVNGMKAWEAFRGYEDADGFFFINYFASSNEENTFCWSYYPPRSFKVLLYFPESGTFAVSGSLERYAFDSYYQADLTGDGSGLTVRKAYNYGGELVALLARILITFGIEIVIALFFGLRKGKVIRMILLVNLITQIVLNVLLNGINRTEGPMAFVFNYIWMELVVMALEAILYTVYFKRIRTEKPIAKWVAPVYAVTANAASFAVGLMLASKLPEIF